MTNQKAAIIRGMERYSHTEAEYIKAIRYAGLEIINERVTVLGNHCIEAELEMNRGVLHIYCGVNGTARIDKPNGTHKWVYEKTPNQITAQLKQIIDFYK